MGSVTAADPKRRFDSRPGILQKLLALHLEGREQGAMHIFLHSGCRIPWGVTGDRTMLLWLGIEARTAVDGVLQRQAAKHMMVRLRALPRGSRLYGWITNRGLKPDEPFVTPGARPFSRHDLRLGEAFDRLTGENPHLLRQIETFAIFCFFTVAVAR